MPTQIDRSETTLSVSQLDEVELRLSFRFPEEYRQFLLAHNGGKPQPGVFHFTNDRGTRSDSCVDWFLAIYDGEYDNFETYFNMYKVDQVRLPAELIPIAHDPGGNLVCISVDGPRCGAIYFWDHEKEAGNGDTPTYSNVYIVSQSFNQFLDSLTDSP